MYLHDFFANQMCNFINLKNETFLWVFFFFILKPKLTGSSYIHILKLCQTNQRVSANKFKLFSQSSLIKQNTVIWQHWLPWLVIVLMWSFIKLPWKSIYWSFSFHYFSCTVLFRRMLFDCRVLWCSARQTVCPSFRARNQKSGQGLSGQDLAARCTAAEEHWHSFHPSSRHKSPPGMWTSWGPGWDVGLWIGVRIRPGKGTHGLCTQDGLAGSWKWAQGQANSTPGDGAGHDSPWVML